MARANINDRSTIENLYPKSEFDQEAAGNSRGKAAIIKGLKILSAPDAQGEIELARASQHVGESAPDTDSIFVAAYRAGASIADNGTAYESSTAPTSDNRDEGADYRNFIDEVLEKARSAQFQPPIGKGEERLKGFHGG